MPAYDYYTWDDLLYWSDTETLADIAEESVDSIGEAPVVTFVAHESTDANCRVYVPAFSGITADYDFTDVVPAGYMLDKIVVQNNVGSATTMDFGTTASGAEIADDLSVAGSGYSVVNVPMYFGYGANTTLYLNNLSSSANIDVAFVLIKIIAS